MTKAKTSTIFNIIGNGIKVYTIKEKVPTVGDADYISGMTDQYAIRRYEDLFIPKPLSEGSNEDALFRRIKDELY